MDEGEKRRVLEEVRSRLAQLRQWIEKHESNGSPPLSPDIMEYVAKIGATLTELRANLARLRDR
jgi:hypothetical protein